MTSPMAVWKNDKEKHTPFAAKGNGRLRELEERLERLEQAGTPMRLLVVDQPPETCLPNTVYLVCEDIND